MNKTNPKEIKLPRALSQDVKFFLLVFVIFFLISDTRWFAAGPAITDISVSSLNSTMTDNQVYLAVQSQFAYSGVLMAIDLQATAPGDLEILVRNNSLIK